MSVKFGRAVPWNSKNVCNALKSIFCNMDVEWSIKNGKSSRSRNKSQWSMTETNQKIVNYYLFWKNVVGIRKLKCTANLAPSNLILAVHPIARLLFLLSTFTIITADTHILLSTIAKNLSAAIPRRLFSATLTNFNYILYINSHLQLQLEESMLSHKVLPSKWLIANTIRPVAIGSEYKLP